MRGPRVLVVIAAMFWIVGTADRAQANPFTFATLPTDGEISDVAGSTIGWGYMLANPSATDWLVLASVAADIFEQAVPNAFIFDFPILAPGSSVSVAYQPGVAGLFELTWDAAATPGIVNSGTFIVSAEWWSDDPFAGGSFVQLATDQFAAYTASVTQEAPVPEPSSLALVATSLVAAGVRLRAVRRRR